MAKKIDSTPTTAPDTSPKTRYVDASHLLSDIEAEEFRETGYVFAPYVPMVVTPLIVFNSFTIDFYLEDEDVTNARKRYRELCDVVDRTSNS